VTQYLLFDAGGLDLAAPSNLVKTIHEDLSVQPVSGTRDWFCGIAVAQGKLLPITDIGAFAGRRSSTGRTLELDPSATIAGLQVDQVHGLTDQTIDEIPLSELERSVIADGNLTFSERAIVKQDRAYRILDIGSLVQSSEFLDISAGE